MMSVQMQQVYEVAREIDSHLTAFDFPPGSVVVISHDDGSRLVFHNAFITEYFHPDNIDHCEYPGEWLLVFTEHHAFHVYHKADLSSWGEYQKVVRNSRHQDHPGDRYFCKTCDSVFPEPNWVEEKQVCPNGCKVGSVRLMTVEERTAKQKEKDTYLRKILADRIAQLEEQISEIDSRNAQ